MVGDVTDVRFVSREAAVLHAYGGTMLREKTEAAPERDSIQTLVAVPITRPASLPQRLRGVAYTSIHETLEHPAKPCPPPGIRSTNPISSTRLKVRVSDFLHRDDLHRIELEPALIIEWSLRTPRNCPRRRLLPSSASAGLENVWLPTSRVPSASFTTGCSTFRFSVRVLQRILVSPVRSR